MIALFHLLVALLGVAHAGELDEIKLFVGERHAQVLLIADGEVNLPTVRSNGAVGSAPARATLKVRGLELSEELEAAYRREEGRWLLPVDRGGVHRIALAAVGDELVVTVELDDEREVEVTRVGERGLLVDLIEIGAEPDRTLSSAEMFESWMAGVSLERRAAREIREHYVVVLDPGHGGWDPGAIGVSGSREADICLALARRVARELERDERMEVVLTRNSDLFIPLVERANIANNLGADLFISIHANASPREAAWGIETYFLDAASDAGAARVEARENALAGEGARPDSIVSDLQLTGTNRLSQVLAQGVQERVVRGVAERFGDEQVKDLGVKSALFAVLVWSRMPAILFESSFVTNPADETRLRLPQYQESLAIALSEAVVEWFEQTGE